jgi:hypothetical protein
MEQIKFYFKIETHRSFDRPEEEKDDLWNELLMHYNQTGKAEDVNKWINDPKYINTLKLFHEIDSRIQVRSIKFTTKPKPGARGLPLISNYLTCTVYSTVYEVIGTNFTPCALGATSLCTAQGSYIPISLSFPIQEQNGVQVEIIRD